MRGGFRHSWKTTPNDSPWILWPSLRSGTSRRRSLFGTGTTLRANAPRKTTLALQRRARIQRQIEIAAARATAPIVLTKARRQSRRRLLSLRLEWLREIPTQKLRDVSCRLALVVRLPRTRQVR